MDIKNDQNVVRDGRQKILKDTEEVKVVVPLRDQIVDKLVAKLEDQGEGQKTVELWQRGNSERADWLERQERLLETFDEFIEPIYNPTNDWSSTLHLPVVLTVCKTFHARFLAALQSIDPSFTVKARQAANVDRASLIQELMRYTLNSWINKYSGAEDALDSWIWSWVTTGSGVLKARWHKEYSRFIDVVQRKETQLRTMPNEFGQLVPVPTTKEVEEEKETLIEICNGPMLEFVPNEEVLIIGGGGDPQLADDVLQSTHLSASQLWSLVDQGIFRKDAVERVIKSGETVKGGDAAYSIQQAQAASSGSSQLDSKLDHDRYQIIERYARIDVDGSGIASDVILWVHKETGAIVRATYLFRVMKTGLRPFFKIDFHKRHGQDHGVGLPELLYSLAREIDAVHNMKVDFGLISSMPFGFYRATSSLEQERMPMEPGVLIPLDNPQTDVFFPQLGNRGAFNAQEEQTLYSYIERFTSISDLSLGIVGGQGAARTATGARALLGESNANLDVYLRRMNRGWKRALTYLFHMLQERVPAGFQFRILGDDGALYWETIKDRMVIAGAYDFDLEANSANSNKQVQIEQANSVLQTIANPLFMQMGIVNPMNVFQAIKTKLQTEGVRDWARYITKPANQSVIYTPEELANATLHGIPVKLGPEQDLQGFLDYFQHIVDNDDLLGQFSVDQTVALAKKAQEAQAMIDAISAQQGQIANAQQMSMNASMAAPSPQGAGAAAAQPAAVGTEG